MVALRSRRLEELFGTPLDALTAAHRHGLVEARTQEMFDPRLQGGAVRNTEGKKTKLAGDMAAMANTAGGVVLIGIEEDDQARAMAAPGVEVSEAERGRIRQIVASQVARPARRFGRGSREQSRELRVVDRGPAARRLQAPPVRRRDPAR